MGLPVGPFKLGPTGLVMKARPITLCVVVLITCFTILNGCATHWVRPDDARQATSRDELLRLLGRPDSTKQLGNGLEEWSYNSQSHSILRLEHRLTSYVYVLDKNGKVLEKKIEIIKSKRRILPVTELPEDFNEFK